MSKVIGLLLALVCALSTVSVPATAAPVVKAHTVTYDQYSLRIDDKPVQIFSAEFHYFRLPSPDQWADVLEKVKAAGFNAVSLYFDWGYHSPKRGVYDFTGVRDVERLLRMTEDIGLYVIARPGPYINAEVSLGGFPGWLTTNSGVNRTSEPGYLNAAREWMDRINPIIARHQLTRGTGNVILYQVENEYQGGRQDADYMQALIDWARAAGIDVPTFVNDGGPNGNWISGKGAPDIYGFDAYPQGFDCWNPDNWRNLADYTYVRQFKPTVPLFMPEAQGGSFDGWGGAGFENCRKDTDADFTRVFSKMSLAAGVSLQNFYMTFGGTNFGWLADPNAGYTSYDYGAPITESRGLTAKYTEFKRLAGLLQAVTPLSRTDLATAPAVADPALRVDRRVNPDTGTQFFFLRHTDTTVKTTNSTPLALNGRDGAYTIPAVPVNGRDSKLLVAGYDLGGQRLVYSTSEIFTHARIGVRDVALLYGRDGEAGQTVLRYSGRPTVKVLSGSVQSTWDAARGDLKLDYRHSGLARVLIDGGGRTPLELLLGTDAEAGQWWRQDTASGTVLVRGPYLVRKATLQNGVLALTGDTSGAGDIDIVSPGALAVSWNGRPVDTTRAADGSLHGRLNFVPQPANLPVLTGWRSQDGAPEAAADFDDSGWTAARGGAAPVLATDQYGFHHGDVWYRGRFPGTGKDTTISLDAATGNQGVYAAWLNGVYLGSSGNGKHDFTGVARAGENVLSVLVENMGHNEEWGHDYSKEPRGLLSGSAGATTITWKIQGNRGGEDLIDPARGPFNAGGLYGERAGFPLQGFPDQVWPAATLPASGAPGVKWYRTNVKLDLPRGQDNAVGLRLTDDPAKHYRVQIYVNGWLAGRYLNDVGPQHDFVLPAGILHQNGDNTIALAVWSADGTGPGNPQLIDMGRYAGGVAVQDVAAPGWTPALALPKSTASLTASADAYWPAGSAHPVTASFAVPAGAPAATAVKLGLDVPAGWTAVADGPVDFAAVAPGQSVSVRWQVTPQQSDPYSVLTAKATFTQAGQARTVVEPRAVQVPPPAPTGTRYVSDLTFVREANGWGPVERDKANGENGAGDGGAISVGGTVYAKGLGVHAASDVRIYLGGGCHTLTATVGLDDEVADNGSVVFSVLGDDTARYTSPVLHGADPGTPVSVDLTGVTWLDLAVSDGGDNNYSDHADWADAAIAC